MRKYEIMYIIAPNLDETATKEIIERYKEVLINNGAEVTTVDEIGKRRLAYEIKKFREGFYVRYEVKANPEAIAECDRLMKINEHIIRTLIVKEDE